MVGQFIATRKATHRRGRPAAARPGRDDQLRQIRPLRPGPKWPHCSLR